MELFKEIVGVIAVLVTLISYIPYFRDIFAGHTKPHAVSWLVWGIVNSVIFVGQVTHDGGAGAWMMGVTALFVVAIFVLAAKNGLKHVNRFDWLCLAISVIAIVPWLLTKDPLFSVILVTVIDLVAFIPTIRKAFILPFEETLSTWSLSVLKYALGIVALGSLSLANTLFPLTMVVANGLFVLMLIMRRHRIISVSKVLEPQLV